MFDLHRKLENLPVDWHCWKWAIEVWELCAAYHSCVCQKINKLVLCRCSFQEKKGNNMQKVEIIWQHFAAMFKQCKVCSHNGFSQHGKSVAEPALNRRWLYKCNGGFHHGLAAFPVSLVSVAEPLRFRVRSDIAELWCGFPIQINRWNATGFWRRLRTESASKTDVWTYPNTQRKQYIKKLCTLQVNSKNNTLLNKTRVIKDNIRRDYCSNYYLF